MKLLGAMALIALLAGCGADGPPVRPELATGVTISSDGIDIGAWLGVSKGPVSVSVGL